MANVTLAISTRKNLFLYMVILLLVLLYIQKKCRIEQGIYLKLAKLEYLMCAFFVGSRVVTLIIIYIMVNLIHLLGPTGPAKLGTIISKEIYKKLAKPYGLEILNGIEHCLLLLQHR
jgi:ABC-type dipeptide/oligopeptide/nickel transport system permease subunit